MKEKVLLQDKDNSKEVKEDKENAKEVKEDKDNAAGATGAKSGDRKQEALITLRTRLVIGPGYVLMGW